MNKERSSFYGMRYRDTLKQEMVEAYGGKCATCDESHIAALCLDHINDDAHVEREYFEGSSRGGGKLYAKLKKEGWPQGRFQLLCYNCNALKEGNRRRKNIGNTGEYADRVLVQARIGRQRNNISGIKGVFWNSQKKKWHARIIIGYMSVHIGFYNDIIDAAIAYRERAIEEWGEDANLPSYEEVETVGEFWKEFVKKGYDINNEEQRTKFGKRLNAYLVKEFPNG